MVGQTHNYPRPICCVVGSDGTLGVSCEEGAVSGLDDEEQIGVVVDVMVEVDLVERVELEEQFGAADSELSVCLQGLFEEELVVVVVL